MASNEPQELLSAPVQLLAMACEDASCNFKPMRAQRRPVGDYDVLIDMKYCGVCHTDLHWAAGHVKALGRPKYPCTPGHELAGVVERVGSKVTKFKPGDHIGVGCMVDSCLECAKCKMGKEQKCKKNVLTYQGEDWSGRAAPYPEIRDHPMKPGKTQKSPLMGGYSSKMVVHERFGVLIPPDYPLECAGPVMCAGITMYDPLKAQGAGPGTMVGIAGLGGLGVMGIKLAKAMGCKVTAISRSEAKKGIATAAGAESYIALANPQPAAAKTLALILDTIPVAHDLGPYKRLLQPGGKLIVLGLVPELGGAVMVDGILGGRASVGASAIGGIANTQEVINLCDKTEPKILPSIQLMPVSELSQIYEKLDGSNDAGVRYVLDLQGTLNEEAFTECTGPPPQLQEPAKPFTFGAIFGACCSLFWGECSCSCWGHCCTCGAFYPKKVHPHTPQE
mmetsp:Transcript_82760/g.229753  ORF Transcript_82760/g.229753 Transcript_82760/m.229753 type:complete len:449 (-) Transcript_82760:327-1673(-)